MNRILLIPLFLLNTIANAQYLFKRDYNFAWNYSVVEIENNSYMIGGTDTSGQIGITKIDNMGNVVWNNTYGFEFGHTLTRTNSNLFLMTGDAYPSQAFVLLVDSNGNSSTLNLNTATGQYFSEYDVLKTFDQNFVMTAKDTFPLLIKFDPQGNVLWRQTFPAWNYTVLHVIQQPDSGFILLGDTSGTFFVAKTNSDGDTLWTKYFYNQYGISSHSITNCSDGGFIVTASFMSGIPDDPYYPWLLRFNAAGDTMWTQVLWNEYMDNTPGSIRQCHDGGFVMVKNILTSWASSDQDCRVIRLDSTGNVLWDARFPDPPGSNCIQQTSDHGFILATHEYFTGTTVIKFDSLGNYLTLIGETGNESFGIYPNPTSGKFTIELPATKSNVDILIYNAMGEMISGHHSTGNQKIQMDLTNYPAGIYFVRARSGQKIFTGKILKD
jgi:hypothetical protein